MHFSRDGGEKWSMKAALPRRSDEEEEDHEMTLNSPVGHNWRYLTVSNVVAPFCFVLHNGEGEWDSGPEREKGRYYKVNGPGHFCLKDGILTEVYHNLPGVLLVCDLDGTLVGDQQALEEFNDEWERQCVHRNSVGYRLPFPNDCLIKSTQALVYNTGRSLQSTKALIAQEKMLNPSAIITSVGTEVWWLDSDGTHKADTGWESKLMSSGTWDRQLVCEAAKPFLEKEWMHFRPEDEQNTFKVVFGVQTVHVDEWSARRVSVSPELKKAVEAGGKKAQFIASGHGDWNYLDVALRGGARNYRWKRSGRSPKMAREAGMRRATLQGQNYRDGHARGILEGLRKMGFVHQNPDAVASS
eukprot:756307-Hanusia_phi.AAC.6